MEINVNQLRPGMILQRDVVGKSSKPIVPKNTELTDLHIKFIKKFLIEKVSVSPLNLETKLNDSKIVEKIEETKTKNQVLTYIFDKSVQYYKEIFQHVSSNIALEMYKIRERWIPIFEGVADQPLEQIIQLIKGAPREDHFYAKNVVVTFLTVALMKKLGYEQKDFLQIGFAALLSDIGIAKLEDGRHTPRNENWRLHPIHSYRIVEKEVTINKQAKLAILQHHEYLDGTGFPASYQQDKIHPFSQMIAVSDYVMTEYKNNSLEQIIVLLNTYKQRKFYKNIVEALVEELTINA